MCITQKVSEFQDVRGEQKVNEYLHWQHLATRYHCAMYFQVGTKTSRKPIVCVPLFFAYLLEQVANSLHD